MGTDAETVHATFHTDAQATFDDLLAKFNECFVSKVNVIHKRAIFSARCQQSGESVAAYIYAPYDLSELAQFPDKNETITASLILGLSEVMPLQLQE